jgi:hypothetical protein
MKVLNGSTVRSNCLDFTPFFGSHAGLSDLMALCSEKLDSWILPMPRITGEKPIRQAIRLLSGIRPHEEHALEDALGGHG